MTFLKKIIYTKIKSKAWLLTIIKSCIPMRLSTFFWICSPVSIRSIRNYLELLLFGATFFHKCKR